jgi:hypothetical protein
MMTGKTLFFWCMRTVVTIIIIANLGFLQAQDNGSWGMLSMVNVQSAYNADYGYEVQTITVSPLVQSLENTDIELEGYIVPLSGKVEQSHFMLSSLPINMCFFCGKAGPETAIQVFMRNNKKVAFSEEKIKIKGRLIVNPNNQNEILYTLEDATLIKEK